MTTKTGSLVERARLTNEEWVEAFDAIWGELTGDAGASTPWTNLHPVQLAAAMPLMLSVRGEAQLARALWAVVDEIRLQAVTLPRSPKRVLEALADGIEARLRADGIERPHA